MMLTADIDKVVSMVKEETSLIQATESLTAPPLVFGAPEEKPGEAEGKGGRG